MGHVNPAKRPTVMVEDSKWTGYFIELQPLPCSHQKSEVRITDRRDELVHKVRRCIIQDFGEKGNLLQGMKTVDALERLGVGYHFEQEIATFMDVLSRKPAAGDDLCAVALRFRLLRQHHYDATCDVFKTFLDDNGDFKDTLRSDVDGLLSLYEAAHASKCNEDVLNRAVVFTVDRLSYLADGGDLPRPIQNKVLHALAAPTCRRIKRLQAKLYISIYDEDDEKDYDILELAKLDFHILQQMHRDEVRSICLWYKDLNPKSTIGQFIRGRPVECYYWALGAYYEPHYGTARIMFAKLLTLLTIFDDIFDSYSTLDEVRQFNQAVQSWDEEEARKIGNCYAYILSYFSNAFEEFVANNGASPMAIDCVKEEMKEVSRCMLQELVWRDERQVPTVHEYLTQAAIISVQYIPGAVLALVGMNANDDILSWAHSYPKIMEIAATMCRLMDDIAGHENEKEDKSKCFTAVDCYVNEHGATVQQAKTALHGLLEEQWRRINQEFLSNVTIPVPMLIVLVDIVRTMDAMYIDVDAYSKCSKLADPIHKLLNECIHH